MALKLIAKQLQYLYDELPDDGKFTAGPLAEDLLHWQATVMGPEDSPYYGGRFWIRIDFTADYPLKPPKVYFQTMVFHPNVDSDGKICIDFLQSEWKPSYSIGYVLMAVSSLLLHPNPENAVSQEAASMYLKDLEQFNSVAKAWTLQHAPP